MMKPAKLFSAFGAVLAASLVLMAAPALHAQTPIKRYGALSVSGTAIVSEDGEPVSLAGPSLFWSNKGWNGDRYYNAAVVRGFKDRWNAGIIRAAIGVDNDGGYPEDPAHARAAATAVVDAAIEQDLYVIIDWHSHHAEDHKDLAIDFFEDMARRYGDKPNVIYEIYNEPLNTADWDTVVKPYAEEVIAAIRAIDPDNIIAVGTQTWSQDVDKAADNPIEGVSNIAYVLHFYADTHGEKLREKARRAIDKGLPLIVTEWGSVDAQGKGAPNIAATKIWMAFLRENNFIHCVWSAHDKKEGSSIFKPGKGADGNWSEADLTASGRLAREIISGWSAPEAE